MVSLQLEPLSGPDFEAPTLVLLPALPLVLADHTLSLVEGAQTALLAAHFALDLSSYLDKSVQPPVPEAAMDVVDLPVPEAETCSLDELEVHLG